MKKTLFSAVTKFKKYSQKSIFREYFVKCFVMISIPFLIILATLYYFQQKNIQAEAYRFAGTNFEKSAYSVETIMKELSSTTLRYSEDNQVQSFLSTRPEEHIKNAFNYVNPLSSQLRLSSNSSTVISAIHIYSFENGYILTSGTFNGRVDSFPSESWYGCYRKTGNSNFAVYTDDFYGMQKHIYFSYGLYTGTGLSGLIVYEVDTETLDRLFLNNLSHNEHEFSWLNKEGETLYASAEPSRIPEKQLNTLSQSNTDTIMKRAGNRMYFSKTIDAAYPTTLLYAYTPTKGIRDFLSSYLLFFLCIIITVTMPIIIALVISSNIYSSITKIVTALNVEDSENRTEINEITQICNDIGELLNKNRNMETELVQRLSTFKHAQAVALQTQLNPHFLFNTLNLIILNAKALTHGTNPVSTMVTLLADLLSYALDTQSYFVSVEEEIAHAKMYLQIQQIKYKNNFDCTWQIDPDISQMKIIKMILQPLIENSFQHGISNLTNKRGAITIAIHRCEQGLMLSVADNGLKIPDDRMAEIQERLRKEELPKKGHIGLANISQRVRLIYGEEYSVRITSDANGTKTSVTLPAEPI